jgi:hypothetical protein
MRGAEDTRQAVPGARLGRAGSLIREAALPAHDEGMNQDILRWDDLMTLAGAFP